jgi:hypothetical protein
VAILHEICTPQQPPRLITIPCIVGRPESSDNSFISIGDSISSVVEAVVEEDYYAIKGHSLQIRCKGDNANMISSRRGIRCPRMAMEYNLLKIIGDIEVCTDFKMFKVEVSYPSFFSAHRFFQHARIDVNLVNR